MSDHDGNGDDNGKKPRADYEVGYGKPPVKHRFQRDQSGNPSGRPKRQPTPSETFRKVAKLSVKVSEGGRTRKIATEEAIYRGIRQDALKGCAKARLLWIGLLREHGVAQPTQGFADLQAEDARLLAELGLDRSPSDESDDDRRS